MSNAATSLKERLKDWTDIEGAQYEIAVALGIIDPQRFPAMADAKHVFWSNHPIGNMTHKFLEEMTALGIVQKRDEPDFQYRWNTEFKETPYPIEKRLRNPTDGEIEGRLIEIISDGFNRSLGALEAAGAIDTKKMRSHYKGIGSQYYDVVTEQIGKTAKYGVPTVRDLYLENGGPNKLDF